MTNLTRLVAFALALLAAGCAPPDPPASSTSTATPAVTTAPAAQAQQVTILVPQDVARAESTSADLDATTSHYTLSRREEDLTFTITGSVVNRAESSGDPTGAVPTKPSATIRDVPIFVSENEGIKTATWIEKGTAYAMDIECRSSKDVRCLSNAYILERVRQLLERAR